MTSIDDIRAACAIDPVSHCWLWQRGCSKGQPKVHAFCHARGEKVTQTGPRAVWNIAFGNSPGGLVYRACQRNMCMNPAHLRLAAAPSEVGTHIRRLGSRRGVATDSRRRNIVIAHKALGVEYVPDEKVLEIRASKETGRALAKRLGLLESVVSRIRRGQSYRHLLQPEIGAAHDG